MSEKARSQEDSSTAQSSDARSSGSTQGSYSTSDRARSYASERSASADTDVFDDDDDEQNPEWTESAMIERIKIQLEKKSRNDTRLNATTNTMTSLWSTDDSAAVRSGSAKRTKPVRGRKIPVASSTALGDLSEE
jgi:hypothetical protein